MKKQTVKQSACEAVSKFLSGRGLEIENEYKFHPEISWRMDIALVKDKICIEIDGGLFIKKFVKCGRCQHEFYAGFEGTGHTHPTGYKQDRKKDNAAVILGWKVLRYTTDQFSVGVPGYVRVWEDIKECQQRIWAELKECQQ